MNSVLGNGSAILASMVWSVVSILFKKLGKDIRPIEMNFIKGLFAFLLLFVTMLLLGETWNTVPVSIIILLLISGALGIGFGDTFYLDALNHLGARRTLLLMMLAPPMTAVLAAIFLHETTNPIAWLGIGLTVGGVAWVITERTAENGSAPKSLASGVLFGVLAAVCQAGGAVMSRSAFMQSDITSLPTAVIRLASGTFVLLVWMLVTGQPVVRWVSVAKQKNLWAKLVGAVFFGTYVCVWLQQLAFQYSPAGIAQTLLATSPLFILPIAALMGEKISLRAVLGVLVALAGIVVLFIF